MKTASLHTSVIPLSSPDNLANQAGRPVDIQVFLPGFSELPAAVLGQDAILVPDRIPVTPTRRLVVLVPPGEIDELALVKRVWQLAASSSLTVLYVALEPDDLYLAYQRRRLSGMASLTASKEVRASANVRSGKSWPQALEPIFHPGDLLVCLASHTITDHIIQHKALGNLLVDLTALPAYLIGGLKIGMTLGQQQQIKEIRAWIASIAMIVAFFGLQIRIDRSLTGSFATFILCMSVVAECYTLWKINQWIG